MSTDTDIEVRARVKAHEVLCIPFAEECGVSTKDGDKPWIHSHSSKCDRLASAFAVHERELADKEEDRQGWRQQWIAMANVAAEREKERDVQAKFKLTAEAEVNRLYRMLTAAQDDLEVARRTFDNTRASLMETNDRLTASLASMTVERDEAWRS